MEYVIRDQRQLRALASPVRQAIVDIVMAAGPCTMREVAELMGRPATALYHHVNALRAIGLLTERRATSPRGRPGSLFDVPGRPMSIRYEPGLARTDAPMRRIVGAMTRGAVRDFARSYRPGVTVSGDARRLWAARAEAWLTTAELRTINRTLARLLRVMLERRRPRAASARLHSLTFVLAPSGVGRNRGKLVLSRSVQRR